ncbi:MAG: LysR family transcriptional regulator [Actinobacteria bacterium]|nr:LysR family transcriptional regulator [Actinomycetota bacterium]
MRRISLRELENLVALAEHCSVTRAAYAVGLSQPAMSAALKRLEHTVGSTLFVRQRGQGIRLTPEGEILVAEARSLMARSDELQARISGATSARSGRLVVAALVTVAPIVIPSLVRRFQATYPDVMVEIRIGSQDQLLDWLATGVAHLAITYDLEFGSAVDFERLIDAGPCAVLPEDHPLAIKNRIHLSELADEPYILLDLPVSREYFTSLFLAADISCIPARRYQDLALVRAMVGNGFGYSLVNLLPASDVAQDGSRVAYVPIESPVRPLRLGLARRFGDQFPRSQETFIQFTRDSLVLPR